jgi:hypothetical protein
MRAPLTVEAVLVARTMPEPNSNNELGVCSVWYSEAIGLFRVYPLEVRNNIKVWDVCVLKLTRSSKDHRYESWKAVESPTKVGREDRLNVICRLVEHPTSIARLNNRRASLGIIVPTSMTFRFEVDHNPLASAGRRSMRYRPRVDFTDHDDEGTHQHRLAYNSWDAAEFVRKFVDEGKRAPGELWDAMRVDASDRATALLVGNLRDHPTSWLVINRLSWIVAQGTLGTSFVPPFMQSRNVIQLPLEPRLKKSPVERQLTLFEAS